MAASSKTLHIAQTSLARFFARHQTVYYWTFTFAECVSDKSLADHRWKPFEDLIKRRGGELLVFWELQDRGAWHVHCVTDVYLDVNWLRPWMMARGWGQMMKVKRVASRSTWVPGRGWVRDEREEEKLVRYLLKYLTKCLRVVSAFKKKAFGGSAAAKAGTTLFKWLPEEKPGAYLYYYGRQLYREIYGRVPVFSEVNDFGAFMRLLMQMGYEATGWCDVDPLWEPPGG